MGVDKMCLVGVNSQFCFTDEFYLAQSQTYDNFFPINSAFNSDVGGYIGVGPGSGLWGSSSFNVFSVSLAPTSEELSWLYDNVDYPESTISFGYSNEAFYKNQITLNLTAYYSTGSDNSTWEIPTSVSWRTS
jgi:hypothetical protein